MSRIEAEVDTNRIAEDIAGAEFLAGVEITTLAGNAMEWMESAATIQRGVLEDLMSDWSQTGAAMQGAATWNLWLDHVGRRISHLSASALALQALNEREIQRMLGVHAALFRRQA